MELLAALIVLVLAAGCTSAAVPAPSATPVPPSATPVPPTATPVPPTPTPSTGIAVVSVSPEVMEVLSSWDEGIVFFTSAQTPIASLQGLTADEVGLWGAELMPNYLDLFQVVGEPKESARLTGTGHFDELFTAHAELRFFITWESEVTELITKEGGGLKIRFEVES
jgi:hypothetical protein